MAWLILCKRFCADISVIIIETQNTISSRTQISPIPKIGLGGIIKVLQIIRKMWTDTKFVSSPLDIAADSSRDY